MDKLKANLETAQKLVDRVEAAAAMGAPTDPTPQEAKRRLGSARHYLDLAQMLAVKAEDAMKTSGQPVETRVAQPTLAVSETFNPAAQPICSPDDVM